MRARAALAARGFGLLEAIVAMALLASTGVALFGWINQNLQQAVRLQEHEQRVRLQLTAQSLIETVNPMQMPRGEMALGPVTVTWSASAMQPVRRNASSHQRETGAWQVGLYALEVRATDRVSGVEARFVQWRTGTERLQEAVVTPP
jgi:general secretion pathway protein I